MIVDSFDFVSKPKGEQQEQKPYTPPTPQYERAPAQPMPQNNLPQIDINEDEIPF